MKANWSRLAPALVLTALVFALPALAAEPPAPPSDETLALEAPSPEMTPEVTLEELFGAEAPDPKVVLNCSWADKPIFGCYYYWNPETLCCRLSGYSSRCASLICL